MTGIAGPEAAAEDRSRLHRFLVGAGLLLIVLPTLLVALFGLLVAVMILRQGSLLGVLSIVQVVIALVALAATFRAGVVFFGRGRAALAALSPWTLGAMHAGAAMVVLGVLGVAIQGFFPLGYFGKHLAVNLIGAPALLPYFLLMRLHRQAGPAASAVPSDRRALWGPCLVLLLATTSLATMGPKPFDRGVWVSLAQERDDTWLRRQRMALWLIGTRALQANERPQVLAMLGPPTQSDWFDDGALAYPLGRGLGFFLVDDNWLLIEFDERDRVADVRVVAPD